MKRKRITHYHLDVDEWLVREALYSVIGWARMYQWISYVHPVIHDVAHAWCIGGEYET